MRHLCVAGPINRRALRRPVVLAWLLGLASAGPAGWWLLLPPQGERERLAVGWQPLAVEEAMALSLVAVLAASTVGGGLAGRTLARHRTSAPLLAVAVAWPTAIAILPIAASVLGIPLRAGIVCLSGCSATLTDERAVSGIDAYLNATALGAVTLVTSLPALGVALGGVWLGRRGHHSTSAGAMVIGYGCLNVWSILLGGAVPFLLLAAGVLVWARIATRDEMQESDRSTMPGSGDRDVTERAP